MKISVCMLALILCVNELFSQSDFIQREDKIDSLMMAHIIHTGKHPVHSFLLYAKNEKSGFAVHKGKGTIGRNDNSIDSEYQYNVASITKMLVATLILQLEEEGKLQVTDKAAGYLSRVDYLRFPEFVMHHDTAYADSLVIQHLLQHTSGISDIFKDAATRFNISVLLHKKRQYITAMIIDRYFRYNLHKKPGSKPGKGYHYSDINYMLLGLIVEQVTGQSLPQAIRERILVPLNMQDSYFEYYEPEQGKGKRIDAFLNGINMTKKINTSYEWGGGGLVSTTKDMAVFIEALFDMKLFRQSSTLKKMTDDSVTEKYGANYGMGIYQYKLNDRIFYGHGGFYGSLLAYDPVGRITLSANIGQANPPYDAGKLVKQLLDIILDE